MKSTLSKALDKLMLNQLAQVCNNLHGIIQQAKECSNSVWLVNESVLAKAISELESEYNKLFKLIYGDK